MYTFSPIPPIDTTGVHSGFMSVVFLSFFVALLTAALTEEWDSEIRWTVGIFLCSLLIYTGNESWSSGTVTHYKNEAVVGEYIGAEHEYQTVTVSSGKTSRVQVNHNNYVTYRVPEGLVTFNARVGIAYPERAVLYKN